MKESTSKGLSRRSFVKAAGATAAAAAMGGVVAGCAGGECGSHCVGRRISDVQRTPVVIPAIRILSL